MSPQMGVPKPQATHWACHGKGWGHRHPTAQGPSTHLLVQLLPQGFLDQRCQRVVEPAVGQSRVLRSPWGAPASPRPTSWPGTRGSPCMPGTRGKQGVLASPVAVVKLHVQIGATGVTACAPHCGPAAAVHAHPQHRHHGQVVHAKLDGALVLAGDRAGEHRASSGPEPPRYPSLCPAHIRTHMVPSWAPQSALRRMRARCTVSLTPTSSAKSTVESFICSSWMRILHDTGSLGSRLRPGHCQDGNGDRDRDPVGGSYRGTA